VRCGVLEDDAAGLGLENVLEVAGFAVLVLVVDADVDVGVAAFVVDVHAARADEEVKLRCGIRYATGADLEEEAERRAETPLRADGVAIVCVGGCGGARWKCRVRQREVTISVKLGPYDLSIQSWVG